MAVAERGGLFTTKPTKALVAEAEERGHQLGAWSACST